MTSTNVLTDKDVRQVASLAKLNLSEPEVEKFKGQLSDILNYMEELKQVDTSDVSPTAQVGELVNVFRDDKFGQSLDAKDALSQSKSTQAQYFKVEAIFE